MLRDHYEDEKGAVPYRERGGGIKGYFKAPSRILFDIVESLLDVIGSIPAKLKAECACQIRKFDKKDAGGLQGRGGRCGIRCLARAS